MPTLEDALTLAINVLRDSAESSRMPSRVPLGTSEAKLHEEAAAKLERMRQEIRVPASKA
jgi:hypothetical protein